MDYDLANDEERKAYHRNASQKNREEWKALGASQVTSIVPDCFAGLVRGQITCATACYLSTRLHDDDDRYILANRVPKYRILHADIELLYGVSKDLDKMCDHMMELLREARMQKADANDASNGVVLCERAAANEYIMVHYLTGYYDIAVHIRAGGVAALPSELDLEAMKEVPNVL